MISCKKTILNSQNNFPELSGAGGNWPVINEVVDPETVKQQNRICCGPACAEMFLREQGINHLTKATISSATYTPVSVSDLALTLNQLDPSSSREWIGGCLEIPGANDGVVLDVLMATGIWIAELREPGARLGHLVVVDGFDDLERLKIRDPWDSTRYKMDREEFLTYWTLQAIYLKKL